MAWFELVKSWAGHPAGEQVELSEADGKSLVDTGFAKAVDVNPESDIIAKATASMAGLVGEAITKSVDKALEVVSQNVKRPRIEALEQEADRTKSLGDFLVNVYSRNEDRLFKAYGAKAALAEGSGTTGGYTVPPEFLNRLLSVESEEGFIRALSTNITMGSRTLQIPALDQTTVQSSGVSPFFGGMQAKWVDEAGSRPETEPTFKQIELVAHELSGYVPVSKTLLADSGIALDQLLTTMFGKVINWTEERAFLQGDGVGKPKGIINSAATISVTRAGGAASTTFALADAANMWSKLLPASQNKAVWIMSQSLIPKLIQLSDASNRVVYLPNVSASMGAGGTITQSMPMSLLGRPIYFTEKSPVLGGTGDVVLADLSYYLVGDRGTIEVAASEHALFLTNQMAWRFVKRVDGKPWLDSYITYSDASTTVSPFVKLV